MPLKENQLDEIINLVSKEEELEMNEQIAKALENKSSDDKPCEGQSEQNTDSCKEVKKASPAHSSLTENTAIAESTDKAPIAEPEKPGSMKL